MQCLANFSPDDPNTETTSAADAGGVVFVISASINQLEFHER